MIRLALLFGFSLSLLFTSAQVEISVSAFRLLENDLTARTVQPEYDVNGELTALIKVVTVESGFVFEGGSLGIAKAIQKEGEWWVYVPSGARTITIRHPRLGVLRNYAYPVAISAGNVYEMRLVHGVVETVIKEREILSEFVVIESNPSGADVYLNGEPVGKTPFSSEKPEGRYEWRVETNLYQPKAGVFDLVAGEKAMLNVELIPNFGTIRVVTRPEEGATILLNGIDMGRTSPATLDRLPKGTHTITVSSEWYETTSRQINVVEGQTEEVVIEMKPTFAKVTVPASADEEVFVNGASKGQGTWIGRLAPGVYAIEKRRPYHESARKQLNLASGDEETVELEVQPIFSSVKIQSNPIGAEIYLNGELKGTTPQIVRELLVGEYELTLRKSGYNDLTEAIVVKEGETADYVRDLSTETTAPAATEEQERNEEPKAQLEALQKQQERIAEAQNARKNYTASSASSAQQVFDRYYDALGGASAIEVIETRVEESLITVSGMEMTMIRKSKGADKFVMEFNMTGGISTRQVLNGNRGSMNSMGTVETMTDEQVRNLKMNADLLWFYNLSRYNATAEYKGTDQFNGEEVERVDVTQSTGVTSFFFSKRTGLMVGTLTMSDGSEITTKVIDYMEVDGILFPKRSQTEVTNQVITSEVQEIRLNVPISDSEFTLD